MGGYDEIPLSSAAELDKYLDTHLNSIDRLTLTKYERQVVNGFNHRLTYKD